MERLGEDTICAIATPMGEGGVGIVRLSGPEAIAIAGKVVRPRKHHSLNQLCSHRLYLCDIVGSHSISSPDHFPLDEGLVVIMREPRSFTGEDVVELHTHGGPFLLQTVCEAFLQKGARLAEPGEFTKRAFLNGRVDLTQAEAVLDTITARTMGSLRTAQSLLRGSLRKEVEEMRDELIGALAHLEAGLDFVEEDVSFIQREQLERVLLHVREKLQNLIHTFEEGRIIREGINVAIIGKPNVGKSSLLNALLKMDRAIVSSTPGTTRDVIDESITLSGIQMRLLDTAGLRKTCDFIEEEGIRRTHHAIEDADLLLLIFDASTSLTQEDLVLLQKHAHHHCLIVLNKSDLLQAIQPHDVVKALSAHTPDSCPASKGTTIVNISAKTGDGIEKLKTAIRDIFFKGEIEAGHGPIVTHLRHKVSLVQALDSIVQAQQSVRDGRDEECIALDMRGALDSLGHITGAVYTEDILDRVFRDFCIGK